MLKRMRSTWIRGHIEALTHLFFPMACLGCGTGLEEGEEVLCATCHADLPLTRYWEVKDNPIERMFWGKLPIERASSFLFFSKGGKVQAMLHKLKYKGRQSVGRYLGRTYAQALAHHAAIDYDAVIPLPLHRSKLRKRGYNQCTSIAEGMSAEWGIPAWHHAVIRREANESQTRKGRFERWENVKDLFVVNAPSELAGKHVLLIDDVITTGATMEACATALLKVPGIKVSIATIGCPSPV